MTHPTSMLLACVACITALGCGREVGAPASPTPTPLVITPLPPQPAPALVVDAPPIAHDDACIEVDADLGGKHITLEGAVLVDDAHEHPTRGKTRPYILRLDRPRCVVGLAETSVTELHLASEGLAFKPLVGKHVRVSGDPFAAHTAWHARPVVLMTTTAAVTH